MCDQIEFANVILLNKTDLVTDKEKEEIKNTIKQFNQKAEIIETIKSKVDLDKVINTSKFNFEEAQSNLKWLKQDRYDINPETEEYGVSSFLYKRDRPFNPSRLYKVLESNFMLGVIDPNQHDHEHDHGEEDQGEDQGEVEEMKGEEIDEDETEEEYQARLAAAKESFKAYREAGNIKKQAGVFKHLFRSKGFIWLSTQPNLFFEWSQAAVQ